MSGFDEFDVCRNILESLLTGVCVIDIQKRIVFWSEGAERITGRLRHEVIGHSCVQEALLHCQQNGCEFCGEECPLSGGSHGGKLGIYSSQSGVHDSRAHPRDSSS